MNGRWSLNGQLVFPHLQARLRDPRERLRQPVPAVRGAGPLLRPGAPQGLHRLRPRRRAEERGAGAAAAEGRLVPPGGRQDRPVRLGHPGPSVCPLPTGGAHQPAPGLGGGGRRRGQPGLRPAGDQAARRRLRQAGLQGARVVGHRHRGAASHSVLLLLVRPRHRPPPVHGHQDLPRSSAVRGLSQEGGERGAIALHGEHGSAGRPRWKPQGARGSGGQEDAGRSHSVD